VYKLNAATGEIIWEVPFACSTVTDLSGGVQGTPLLGKEGTELEGLIIYPIARTPSNYKGKLVAIDTNSGEIVWETSTGSYAWSSPTAVYTPEGKAYIFQCDVDGDAKLYDAQGQRLTTISFGSTVEASPVVFNDMIIIGSRGGRVFGVKIS
jgi:outer membrane protein assembly factor BamB